MTSYTIRIVRSDGQTIAIDCRLMGDHAAIRRAKTLAMAHDLVEVWRGAVCVFQNVDAMPAGLAAVY